MSDLPVIAWSGIIQFQNCDICDVRIVLKPSGPFDNTIIEKKTRDAMNETRWVTVSDSADQTRVTQAAIRDLFNKSQKAEESLKQLQESVANIVPSHEHLHALVNTLVEEYEWEADLNLPDGMPKETDGVIDYKPKEATSFVTVMGDKKIMGGTTTKVYGHIEGLDIVTDVELMLEAAYKFYQDLNL